MKVLLLPTLRCNLSCDYCYLQGIKTRGTIEKLSDFHQSIEWIDGLEWFENVYGEIDSIDFSGGEPFLYRDIMHLLIELLKKHGSVNLTSNLELIPDEFFELDPHMIGLTVSLHLKDGRARKRFIETMKRLRERGFRFNINFVGHPSQIEKFEQVLDIAGNFGVGAHLEPYVNYKSESPDFSIKDNPYYTEEDRRGIEYSENREYPTDCNIFGKYAVIAPNGNVYPCLGMMFENRHLLGNIFDRTISTASDNKPIKCDIFCPCAQNYRDGFR